MRLLSYLIIISLNFYTIFASQTSGTWTLTADETLAAEIELTGDLTVNGGGYTLTAADGERLFKTGSHKLVLNNVKLTGGDPSGATTDCGGGDTNSDGCSGGAVLVVGGTLEASDSEFLSNKGFRGSAIFARDGATVTLTDCKVNDNENTKSNPDNYCAGGAVATSQSTTNVHIIRGEVNNNDIKHPTSWGCNSGGLYASSGHFHVTGTTIKGNKGRDGAGIYIYQGSISLTDAIVEDNTAELRGGGIHIYEGEGTITNTIIKNNEAKYEGGGIVWQGWGNKLTTITGSTIEGNKRTDVFGTGNYDIGGGGICIGVPWNYKVKVEIRETTFKDNNDVDGIGHHIFTKRSTSDKPEITLVNNEYLGATGNIIGGHEDGTDSATNFEAAKTCSDSPCSEDPFTSTCADLSDNKGTTCDCASGALEPLTYGSTTCCDPVGCSASSGGGGGGGGGAPACPAGQYPKPQQFYVAVGNNGKIMTSDDGDTWTSRTTDLSGHIEAIAYGNNMYVAVGSGPGSTNGHFITSTDGITWADAVEFSTLSHYPYDIVFANNKFVVTCYDNIYSSTDGVTWTAADPILTNVRSVTGSDSLFVAAGGSGKIHSSTDGIVWTEQEDTNVGYFYGAEYHDGLFIVGGSSSSGKIWKSSDGSTWTEQDTPFTASIYQIRYANGYWVAVASSGYYGYSSDGITWNAMKWKIGDTKQLESIYAVNGKTTLVGDNGLIVTFSDITDRSTAVEATSVDTTQDVNDIIAHPLSTACTACEGSGVTGDGNTCDLCLADNIPFSRKTYGRMIATRSYTLETSDDNGATWTTRSTNGRRNIGEIVHAQGVLAFANNYRVGSYDRRAVFYSGDKGSTWEHVVVDSENYQHLEALAFGNGNWVTCGSGGKYYNAPAPEGPWTQITVPMGTSECDHIRFANGTFMSTYTSKNIAISTDGITWTVVEVGTSTVRDVVFAAGKWVTAETSGTIHTSEDNGATWTEQTKAYGGVCYRIKYLNGHFIATCQYRNIQYSTDGITWAKTYFENMGSNYNMEDITWNGEKYFIVGLGSSHSGWSFTDLSDGTITSTTNPYTPYAGNSVFQTIMTLTTPISGCDPCPTSYGGDGTHCDLCSTDSHAIDNGNEHICTPCLHGGTNVAYDDPSLSTTTYCDYPACNENEHVVKHGNAYICSPCLGGSTKAAGDDPKLFAETSCTYGTCAVNEHVATKYTSTDQLDYEGFQCSDLNDCKTKCTSDGSCLGYSAKYSDVTVGQRFVYAVQSDGTVKIAGQNQWPPPGNPASSVNKYDGFVDSGLTNVAQIAQKGQTNMGCLREKSGLVKCWGGNTYGAMGDGDTSSTTATQDMRLPGITDATDLRQGTWFNIALLKNGSVACWGYGSHEQCGSLGSGSTSPPVLVEGITNAVKCRAGNRHSCCLLSDGTFKCWGEGEHGQLGYGVKFNRDTPISPTLNSKVVDFDLGGDTTCAVLDTGKVYCFGYCDSGQCGSGTDGDQLSPVDTGMEGAVSITMSSKIVCATDTMNERYCWGGSSSYNRVSMTVYTYPTKITKLGFNRPSEDLKVSMHSEDTCVIKTNGSLVCMGRNQYKQHGVTGTNILPMARPEAGDLSTDYGYGIPGTSVAESYTKNNGCSACENGGTRAAGDAGGGADTYCACAANFKVRDNECVACDAGSEKAAGDDSGGIDTACTTCLDNYYVDTVFLGDTEKYGGSSCTGLNDCKSKCRSDGTCAGWSDSSDYKMIIGYKHVVEIRDGKCTANGENSYAQIKPNGATPTDITTPEVIFDSGCTDYADTNNGGCYVHDGKIKCSGKSDMWEIWSTNHYEDFVDLTPEGHTIQSISIGGSSTTDVVIAALDVNGKVLMRGDNYGYRLGDGRSLNNDHSYDTWVQPTGLESGVSQVECSQDGCLAIKDGNLYAWGQYQNGGMPWYHGCDDHYSCYTTGLSSSLSREPKDFSTLDPYMGKVKKIVSMGRSQLGVTCVINHEDLLVCWGKGHTSYSSGWYDENGDEISGSDNMWPVRPADEATGKFDQKPHSSQITKPVKMGDLKVLDARSLYPSTIMAIGLDNKVYVWGIDLTTYHWIGDGDNEDRRKYWTDISVTKGASNALRFLESSRWHDQAFYQTSFYTTDGNIKMMGHKTYLNPLFNPALSSHQYTFTSPTQSGLASAYSFAYAYGPKVAGNAVSEKRATTCNACANGYESTTTTHGTVDTTCSFTPCSENQFISSGLCYDCPTGTRAAGDSDPATNTFCSCADNKLPSSVYQQLDFEHPSFDGSWAGTKSSADTVDGDRETARFRDPSSITKLGDNFYVVQKGTGSESPAIRKIDSNGDVTTLLSSSSNAQTSSTAVVSDSPDPTFGYIVGITTDGTDLYIGDTNRIRKVTLAGEVTTLAGRLENNLNGDVDGDFGTNKLNQIRDLTFVNGAIYFAAGKKIKKMELSANNPVSTIKSFSYEIAGITTDGTDLYVTTTSNCIDKVTLAGTSTTLAGVCSTSSSHYGYKDDFGIDAKFRYPAGIAYYDNALYVVEYYYNNRIRKIDLNFYNEVTTVAGDGTTSVINVNSEGVGLYADSSGLYIPSLSHDNIYRYKFGLYDISKKYGSTICHKDITECQVDCDLSAGCEGISGLNPVPLIMTYGHKFWTQKQLDQEITEEECKAFVANGDIRVACSSSGENCHNDYSEDEQIHLFDRYTYGSGSPNNAFTFGSVYQNSGTYPHGCIYSLPTSGTMHIHYNYGGVADATANSGNTMIGVIRMFSPYKYGPLISGAQLVKASEISHTRVTTCADCPSDRTKAGGSIVDFSLTQACDLIPCLADEYVNNEYISDTSVKYGGYGTCGPAEGCGIGCSASTTCEGYTVKKNAFAGTPQLQFMGVGKKLFIKGSTYSCLGGQSNYNNPGGHEVLNGFYPMNSAIDDGFDSDIKSIFYRSNRFVCVLTELGTVYCWGDPTNGLTGWTNHYWNNNNYDCDAWYSSYDLDLTDVDRIPISQGGSSTSNFYALCAIKTNKELWCWGKNYKYMIKDSDTDSQLAPFKAHDNVVDVSNHQDTMCIVTTAGEVKCRGRNYYGENGDGTSASDGGTSGSAWSTPISSGATSVAVVQDSVCAVVNGGVKCWGSNKYWTYFKPTDSACGTSYASSPTAGWKLSNGDGTCWCSTPCDYGYPLEATVVNIEAGQYSYYIEMSNGKVRTYDLGTERIHQDIGAGYLPNHQSNSYSTSYKMFFTDSGSFIDSSGNEATGDIRPFSSEYGLLKRGSGDSFSRVTTCVDCPTNTTNEAGDTVSTHFATPGTCDRDSGCGQNEFVDWDTSCQACAAESFNDPGATALGTCDDGELCEADRHVVKVWSATDGKYSGTVCSSDDECKAGCASVEACEGYSSELTGTVQVAQTGYTMCVLRNGAVKCWGKNENAFVGDGSTSGYDKDPVTPTGLDSGVSKLACASRQCYAVMDDGTVKGWGYNYQNSLTESITSNQYTPVDLGLTNVVDIAVAHSQESACVIKNDESLWCWGYSSNLLERMDASKDKFKAVEVMDGYRYIYIRSKDGRLYRTQGGSVSEQGSSGSQVFKNGNGNVVECTIYAEDLPTWTASYPWKQGKCGHMVCTRYYNGNSYDSGAFYSGDTHQGCSVELREAFSDVQNIKKLWVYNENSFMLTKTGKLYGWGDSNSKFTCQGECPVGNTNNAFAPDPMKVYEDFDYSGGHLLLVTKSGDIYLYGSRSSSNQGKFQDTSTSGYPTDGAVLMKTDLDPPTFTYSYGSKTNERVWLSQSKFGTCEDCPTGHGRIAGDDSDLDVTRCNLCQENYAAQSKYLSTYDKAYRGNNCDSDDDCKAKCTADSTCEGYSDNDDYTIYVAYKAGVVLNNGALQILGRDYKGISASADNSGLTLRDFTTPLTSGVTQFSTDGNVHVYVQDGKIYAKQMIGGSTSDLYNLFGYSLNSNAYQHVFEDMTNAYKVTYYEKQYICVLTLDNQIVCKGDSDGYQLEGSSSNWNDWRTPRMYLYPNYGTNDGYLNGVDTTDVADICGTKYSIGILTKDGKWLTMGRNNYYNLGHETGTNSGSWFEVPWSEEGGTTNNKGHGSDTFTKITCQQHFTSYYGHCALRNDGKVFCTGSNGYGQLGQGNTDQTIKTAVRVKIPTEVVDVECGGDLCRAIDINGDVWVWGQCTNGNCGYQNQFDYITTPKKVPGLSNMKKLCVTYWYPYGPCAIDVDGKAYFWGGDDNQFGVTSSTGSNRPITEGTGYGVHSWTGLNYGPAAAENGIKSFTAEKKCRACPTGQTRPAGDNLDTDETTCAFTPCLADHHINNGQCTPCPTGTSRPAGDSDPTVSTTCLLAGCATNYRVKDDACVECPAGMTNEAGDTNANGDTYCDATTLCGENEYVKDHVCTSCPSKFYSLPGHDPGGADTHCLPTACAKNERVYSNACTACAYDDFNFAGDLIVMGNTVCDDVDVCDDNHYVGYNYEKHTDDQITNSAGYSDPITDLDKAFRLCNQNINCKGVTQDEGLEQYYLSDGAKAYHADYTAYIKQGTYKCHPCPPGGTRAGGDIANSETGLTTCTFDNCAANQYVSHYECKDCPAGTESPAVNKDVIDSSCHPPACGLNEYVSDYLPDSSKLYGGAACATEQDCKTRCTNNAECEGFTIGNDVASLNGYSYNVHSVLTTKKELYIWGKNGDTDPGIVDSNIPIKLDTGGPIKMAFSGYSHVCVIMEADNKLKCRGDNSYRVLGDGTQTDSIDNFVDVIQGDLPSPPDQMDITQMTSGSRQTYIVADKTIYGWGYYMYCNGYPKTVDEPRNCHSSSHDNMAGKVEQLKCKGNNCCFVSTDEDGYCSGSGAKGQLGDGGTGNNNNFNIVSGEHKWKLIKPGYQHTCGITVDDALYCWGWNANGQLGIDSTTDKNIPQLVFDGSSDDKKVDLLGVGYNNNIVKMKDNSWYGWGTCSYYRCGTTSTSSTIKIPTISQWLIDKLGLNELAKVTEIENQYNGNTRLLTSEGKTYLWGYDTSTDHKLGLGNSGSVYTVSPQTIGNKREYGQEKTGDGDSYTKDNTCKACIAPSTNAAGDKVQDGGSQCDWGNCPANEHVVNNVCTPCPAGLFNDVGDSQAVDTTCDDAQMCNENEYGTTPQVIVPAATASKTLLTESIGGGYPGGIEVGPDGKLYVADFVNDKIYICPEDGTACSEMSGTPTITECENPNGMAWDSAGNMYVACGGDAKIIKIDTSGAITDFIDSGLPNPRKIKIDSNDNLYVNDYTDGKVYKYALPSTTQSQVGGTYEDTIGMSMDSNGNVYVGGGSVGAHKIAKCTPSGTCDDDWSTGYNRVFGIDIDAAGNAFVVDKTGGKLYKTASDGSKTEYESHAYNQLTIVNGVIFAVEGTDTTNDKLYKFSTETVAGSGLACTPCPGAGTNPADRVNSGTTCTFPDCQTDQYSDGDGVCKACDLGRTMPTPVNPSVASQCMCKAGDYVKDEGSAIQAWGKAGDGGTDPSITNGVVSVVGHNQARAALMTDGSVKVWGQASYGGTDPGITDATQLVNCRQGFAVIKSDGSIKSWGISHMGTAPSGSYTKIVGGNDGFAAIKSDGTVRSWGSAGGGGCDEDEGGTDGTSYTCKPAGLSDVVDIFSNLWSFHALKSDGSVVSWGSKTKGGTDQGLTGVVSIVTSANGVAAIKSDGSVAVWGQCKAATDCVDPGITSGATKIIPGQYAFTVIKDDGSLVGIGPANFGVDTPPSGTGFVAVASVLNGFAALKSDGSVAAWGRSGYGGDGGPTTGVFTKIVGARNAFAAIKDDGSVEVWGDSGGGCNSGAGAATYSCKPDGLTNVVDIIDGSSAFAALKSDGSVAAWGSHNTGGIDPGITSGVVSIVGLNLEKKYFGAMNSFVAIFKSSVACAACPSGFTNAGGDDPTGAATTCDFTPCDVDHYVVGTGHSSVCTACASNTYSAGGLVTECDSNEYCSKTQKVVQSYVSDSTKKYGGTACTSTSDCETKCTGDSACAGYTEGPPAMIKAWGDIPTGVFDNVVNLFSNEQAFAALKSDGSVQVWGEAGKGGTDPGITSGVLTIARHVKSEAFAALFVDGSVKTWGGSDWGGCNNAAGETNNKCVPDGLTGVVSIISSEQAFAALKSDGSVAAWGDQNLGGCGSGSGYKCVPSDLSGVTKIYSTDYTFAALKSDGSVINWGSYDLGGCTTASHPTPGTSYTCKATDLSGVLSIASTQSAFAALKDDGSIVAWGNAYGGTDVPTSELGAGTDCVYDSNGYNVAGEYKYSGEYDYQYVSGTGCVTKIVSNKYAFAVLKSDGSVKSWGSDDYGGCTNAAGGTNGKCAPDDLTSGVTKLIGTQFAFLALKDDGSVKAWGGSTSGVDPGITSDVVDIFSTVNAFAVLKSDGSVQVWGWDGAGGTDPGIGAGSGIVQIYSHRYAFAALKSDGTVTAWGDSDKGGTDPSIAAGSGITNIVSNDRAFLALGAAAGEYGPEVTGSSDSSKTKSKDCVNCPEGFQNENGVATLKDGPVNTCTTRNCVVNEYSDGSICKACPSMTGASSDGVDPTAGATQCVPTSCGTNQYVENNECKSCDISSYRLAGDQIFGGDTHCFCKDNHKVINKACVACEAGSSNPNLCYSGLQDHYCTCDADYHVVSNVCTACPAGATRTAGDYGGNADTHCTCGENQHVVSNVCTACTGGKLRPAGDDSSGADTSCSCGTNEHVKEGDDVMTALTTETSWSVGVMNYGPDGDLYVGDYTNNKIFVCPLDGTACSEWTHSPACAAVQGFAWDSVGNMFVSCPSDDKVVKIDTSGQESDFITGIVNPKLIAIDSNDGVYVTFYSSTAEKNMKYYDSSGTHVADSTVGFKRSNTGITVDSDGNLYLGHGSVGSQKIAKCTAIDSCNKDWSTGYNQVYGMDFDASGTLFMADKPDNKIYKISSDGSNEVHDTVDYGPKGLSIKDGVMAVIDTGGALYKFAAGPNQCSTCPTGAVRIAGDFPVDGLTSCACPENFHVSGGNCVACVASIRAAGDDPSAGDTSCACNDNHKVVSNVCTACPDGQERTGGDDAGAADTTCLCKENYNSDGLNTDTSCSECPTGAVVAAGSDPTVASTCACADNYELNVDTCTECLSTEESVSGGLCTCKENHFYDGSACTACAAGSTNPAGDDKTATTTCAATLCAENERVKDNVCVPCMTGTTNAAGNDATGANTQCAYQGTDYTVSLSGNFAFSIDGGNGNAQITLTVGVTYTFHRDSAGNPLRIASAADCEGKDCNKATYNELPTSSLGVDDAEDGTAVTVFTPTAAGTYYYMSTTNGYRKGRIKVRWAACVLTYPITTLTQSCRLSGAITITADLTITYALSHLRAQSGDLPEIVANDASRHFKVTSGRKLSLENVHLKGGRSTLAGGSILVEQGEVDANNVKFTDNMASGQGGAIRMENSLSKLTLNNVLFELNQGSEGGAVSIKDTMAETINIQNSDFKNNAASTGNGGAISSNSVMTIDQTNFEDNRANAGEGGGISATKDVTLTGSSMKRNRALKGGAMRSSGNKIDMSNMVVEDNEAVEEGGAFNAENSEYDVVASTIKANKAKRGAAFRSRSTGCSTSCKKLRIRRSTIENNAASTEAGAIDFDGDSSAKPQFWIQDSIMTGNTAGGSPMDFKKRGSQVKIKAIDSTISNIDGGSVDTVCEANQCDERAESTCETTATGTTCACDGTTKHLEGTACTIHKECTGLGLDVQIRAPGKAHDRLCGTAEVAELTHKLDAKGIELAQLIETKLVSEGVAADQAYALAVEVFGEINKCE